jgi:hypothetical protein
LVDQKLEILKLDTADLKLIFKLAKEKPKALRSYIDYLVQDYSLKGKNINGKKIMSELKEIR